MEFTKLERAAIEMALSESMEGMDVLRTQFAASSVVKRDYTGVGFYTTISVPQSIPPVTENAKLRDQLFGGASGLIRDAGVDISFHLWLRDGYLECLEGVSVGDWPDEGKIEVIKSCLVRPNDMAVRGRHRLLNRLPVVRRMIQRWTRGIS